jgi:Yip1 domain
MAEPTVPTPTEEPGTAESQRGPSQIEAILGVFLRPKETFDRMRSKPRFVLALAVLIVAQVLLAIAIFQSGAVQSDAVAKMEAEGRSEAQVQAVEDYFESPVALWVTAITGGVVFAFLVLLMSGLMFFMGNLMQGAKLTYAHYLSASVHAYLIGLLDQAVRAVLAFQKGTLNIPLGVGLLLPEDVGPLGKMLDTVTDPLLLWSTIVLILGVSVYARRGIRFGILTVLPGYLLGVVMSAFR